jgi:hypothetical protein
MKTKAISNTIYEKITPPPHPEKKTTHNVSTTPTAWEGLQELANQLGCSSISNLLEKMGRQQFHISYDLTESRSDISTELKDLEIRLREFLDSRLDRITAENFQERKLSRKN